MADTAIEISIFVSLDSAAGLWGPYWIDTDTAVIVYIDGSNDLRFTRTTDKGASWTDVLVKGANILTACAWFDQETPGDSGTLVHMAYLDETGGNAHYRTVDVSDASLGTERTVDAGITVGTTIYYNKVAITKTVSGNLIYALSTQTEIECYKSTDGFDTSTVAIADVYEVPTDEDYCLLFPADTGDDNDACALFFDRGDNEITIKMYDDSGNTWTEFATQVEATAIDDLSHINMDGAVRHSDNHILAAWHTNDDNPGDDLKTANLTVDSIAAPTVTATTNIYTDQSESAQCSVFINQQNDDVYVAYMKGGTWQATVDVVYHKSTDDMANWVAESAYSEDAADDVRLCPAGRTVGNAGGRYQPVFFNHDLANLYINEVLDIEIAAAGAGSPAPDFSFRKTRQNVLLRM